MKKLNYDHINFYNYKIIEKIVKAPNFNPK